MEKTIYTKLLLFQKKVEAITKDGKNTFFKKANGSASSYATLGNIISAIKPLLSELELVLSQQITDGVVFSIIIDSVSGEEIKSGITLPNNLDAQKIGSAITYFRRYTLSSLLALEIDEDDDGNYASKQTNPKPTAAAQNNQPNLKEADKIWLNPNTETWSKAIEAMKTGSTSLDKIKVKYSLSEKNETEFLKQVNSK